MSSSTAVEAALVEVVDQIRRGAEPLLLAKGMDEDFKDRYRSDFEDELKTPQDWTDAKLRILPLSRMVGDLATFLTLTLAASQGHDQPDEVDGDCAYVAGFLVSRACPASRGPKMIGKWCKSYPKRGSAQQRAAALLVAGALGHALGILAVAQQDRQ